MSVAKRLFDLFFSSIAIILFIIPALFLAVLIKLDSKGPVFFVQDRVGKDLEIFRIIKFRSMVNNADKLKNSLLVKNEADGPVFKMKNDPRYTRVGRVIKCGIDEIPQFVNVLLGQMSLVGPRPLLVDEVDFNEERQKIRHEILPGMTSLWHINGAHENSFDTWMQMDLDYVENQSLLIDIKILFQTIFIVFHNLVLTSKK